MKSPRTPAVALALALIFGSAAAIAHAAPGGREGARGRLAAVPRTGTAPLDSVARAVLLADLGAARDQIQAGHYAAAESLSRMVLARAEASTDSLLDATVLDVLVEAMVRGGKTRDPDTRRFAERSFAIRERALGPEHLDLVKSVNNLAIVSVRSGDFEEARRLFERVLAIREHALGSEHLDVAASLNNLGQMNSEAGDYTRARALLERALAIRERALGPEHLDVSATLNNLGLVLTHTGDYAQARTLFERALAIDEKQLGPDHPRVALLQNNLGIVLRETGDYQGALKVHRRALAIRETALGPEHRDVAMSLANLGSVLRLVGDSTGARTSLQRALAIRERALGPDHPQVASCLGALALVAMDAQRYDEMRSLELRALAIREKALGPHHEDVALSLEDLAVAASALGDQAAARAYTVRALAIREQSAGPGHPDYARDLTNLAHLDWALTGAASGLDNALRAEEINLEHLRLTCRMLSEREALAFAASRYTGLPTAVSMMLSDPLPTSSNRRVLDAVVRARAVVLDEMAARHRALRGLDDPDVRRYLEAYREAAARYAKTLMRGPAGEDPARHRATLDTLRQEMERGEQVLSAKSTMFQREQRDRSVGLSEVIAALPPATALLAYVAYPRFDADPRTPEVPSYMAYVLRAGSDSIALVRLGDARTIDSLVARWRREAGQGLEKRLPSRVMPAYLHAATALRVQVWDPVASHLNGCQRVFVVPDGGLQLVSFATLPLEDGRYLLETGPLLHYLSAERDLVRPDSLDREGQGLLAMGGAAYDERPEARSGTSAPASKQLAIVGSGEPYRGSRSACGEFAGLRFAPLESTAGEVEDIARQWHGRMRRSDSDATIVLTGVDAGELAFKRNAPGRSVIHLATHGFFFTGRCHSATDTGRRAIGGLSNEPLPVAAVADESPLLLSGLALAGANRRQEVGSGEEDGILTAEEVASLDLEGVRWAVLSACETGVGEIRASEGVLGLRRAFRVAGARTLIMSLWEVDDREARAWMGALYQGRRKGFDTSTAVREASLVLLRKQRDAGEDTHPFHWGAFVAAGDWR